MQFQIVRNIIMGKRVTGGDAEEEGLYSIYELLEKSLKDRNLMKILNNVKI